jgi:hypothetical protein
LKAVDCGRSRFVVSGLLGVGRGRRCGVQNDVAGDERGWAGMGVDEAGVGEKEVAVPGERAGRAGSVGEVAGEGAGGGDVGGDAGAGDVEPVEEGGGG